MKTEKLSKNDINKVNFRWLYGSQLSWNYAKMQTSGYIYAMLPALEKIYKDDPEGLKESLKAHSNFFNTTPHMGHLIIGANVAIEEEQGRKGIEVATSLKTGLMGAMAGVGDSIFGVITPTVFGGIAATMAVKGSSIGLWIWTVVLIATCFLRLWIFKVGYEQGSNVITKMSDKLSALTQAATVLGLVVVGALLPSIVRINIPYEFIWGDIKMSLGDTINQIMPFLPHLLMAVFCYWLLGRKNMTSTKLILFVLCFAILANFFGILS